MNIYFLKIEPTRFHNWFVGFLVIRVGFAMVSCQLKFRVGSQTVIIQRAYFLDSTDNCSITQ